jgi:hypothetical protein
MWLKKDCWVYSSEIYKRIIDDVVIGKLSKQEIAEKYSSEKKKNGDTISNPKDLIKSALYHVVKPNGGGTRLPIADGGWCDPDLKNGYYVVAPGFAHAWTTARGTALS